MLGINSILGSVKRVAVALQRTAELVEGLNTHLETRLTVSTRLDEGEPDYLALPAPVENGRPTARRRN